MKDMSEVKISLLFGKDVEIEGVGTLKSYKLSEILDLGFDTYNKWIGILCISVDDIEELFDYELEKVIDPFNFILQNCILGQGDIKENIIKALETVFNDSVGMSEQGYFFLGHIDENRHIDIRNFGEVVDVLKLQNCVQDNKKRARPKNEAQREYFKKRKKVREMRRKNEGEKDNDLIHIISAVCAKHSSYNLFNIKKLTLHQLINQYKRLCSIEEYSITFQSLMHGASSDDLKIKHWSEPMD